MTFFNQNAVYNPNANIESVVAQSNGRAVLFLFQPLARSFSDQAHRPLTYNLSTDFHHAAHHAAHRVNMGAQPRATVDAVLNQPSAAGVFLPAENPTTMIGLSHLSRTWKFMLVVNGNQQNTNEASMWSRSNESRTMYFGYCLDEPINPTTLHMSEPTLNHDCRMSITHKSSIQQYPTIGQNQTVPRISTMFDVDVVSPDVISALTSTPMQVNDPLHISRNADVTSTDGVLYATPIPTASNNLSNQVSPVVIDSIMHNPHDNLSQIIHAAIIGNSKMQSDIELNRTGRFDSNNYTTGDIITETMESYFQSGTSTVRTIGLNTDDIHTLGSIRHRYRPEIIPTTSDQSIMFSPYDQTNRTVNSVFCSLLCSVIPALLMKGQILQFSFQYQTRNFQNGHDDNWVIQSVQSAIPMDNYTLQNKINAIMFDLQHGLFRMMKDTRDHFEVSGSFGVANVSHCYINFYCDSKQMLDPYEVPTIFGGLTSALLADQNTTFQNTAQYSSLLTALTNKEITEYIPEMRDTAPHYRQSGTPAVINPMSNNGYNNTSVPYIPPDIFR